MVSRCVLMVTGEVTEKEKVYTRWNHVWSMSGYSLEYQVSVRDSNGYKPTWLLGVRLGSKCFKRWTWQMH